MTDADEAVQALLTPEGWADPYPLYDVLRAHAPLPGIVTEYAAAAAILRDPAYLVPDDRFLDDGYTGWRDQPAMVWLSRSMLYRNPPDHGRLRQLVSGAFTPRRIAALEAEIERIGTRLLDELGDDFMDGFAYPMPVSVICALLGVPEGDWSWFRPLASDLTLAMELYRGERDPIRRANAAAEALNDYFLDLLAARRAAPGDGLVDALLETGGMDGPELIANLGLLLFAGFETTTNLLGNGLAILLDRPDVADRLRRGEPAAPFVEEMLRYDAPVQLTIRYQPDGVVVNVVLGAANRDPARFADPDVFDPDRPANQPLSFGAGAHFCLGAALARLEARVAFPLLLRRYPRMVWGGTPVRRERFVFRGYARLPVSVG